jgi:hypothetical protein
MDNERKPANMQIKERDGVIVICFDRPLESIDLDPETARQVAETIARVAYSCRYGIEPQKNTSVIAQEKRMLLVTRISHIIRSMQEKNKLPGVIASHVVDKILQEIT